MWAAPMPLVGAVSGPPQLFDLIADDVIGNAATHEIAWTRDYRAVRISIDHLVPVTDATLLQCRTSSDGGATFDSGASDYRYEVVRTSGTQTFDQITAAALLQLVEAADGLSNAADFGFHGDLVIAQPFDAKPTVLTAFTGYWPQLAVLATGRFYGLRLSAGRVDAIQFFMNSGNISTARIRAVGILPYGEGA